MPCDQFGRQSHQATDDRDVTTCFHYCGKRGSEFDFDLCIIAQKRMARMNEVDGAWLPLLRLMDEHPSCFIKFDSER